MADVVIVVGTKRGKEYVSPIEIKQMIGRAGRKHGGETALAQIIVEDDRMEEVQSELDGGKNMEVVSHLNEVEMMSFHIMPEISSGKIFNIDGMNQWYERSFAHQQGHKCKIGKVLEVLKEIGAIKCQSDDVKSTEIGNIASDLYFHPGDVRAWLDNFTQLFEMGLENDNAAIAWALGTRTHAKSHGDFGDHRFIIGECKSAMPLGVELEEGTVTQVVLWWSAMGGASAGRMRNQMLQLRDDIGRIKRALMRLDKDVAHWDRGAFFDDMELMIKKGIDVNLLDLCKLPGITKGRAEFLSSMGVKDVEGIEGIIESISGEIDESFELALKEIVDGISRKSG